MSNLLLQVFDEGRLTDSLGRVVDFRNTVIVLTSNLGTKTIYSSAFANTTGEVSAASTPLTEEEQRSKRATVAMEIVRSYFAPEFINRLDEVVVFNALTQSSLHEISRMQIEKAKLLLAEHYNVKLQVSEQAIHWFGVYGFNQVQYGARPLKRFIQSNLFDTLAMLLLEVRRKSQREKLVHSVRVSIGQGREWRGYLCDGARGLGRNGVHGTRRMAGTIAWP